MSNSVYEDSWTPHLTEILAEKNFVRVSLVAPTSNIHVLYVHAYNCDMISIKLAEQQPVGRWARTRKYETPRTMKTIGNCA